MDNDFLVGPSRVHHSVSSGRPNDGLGHYQQRCHLDAGKINRCLQALHIFHGSGCINVNKDAHVWGSEGAGNHGGCNCLAHALNRNALFALTWDIGSGQVLEDTGLTRTANNVFAGDFTPGSSSGDIG